jgi:CIC family chloride channel protein
VALMGTGVIAGVGTGALTRVLASAGQAPFSTNRFALPAAGVVTGVGHIVLRRLSSGNEIDTTAAIPCARRQRASVSHHRGIGASLGREGAPKQVAA